MLFRSLVQVPPVTEELNTVVPVIQIDVPPLNVPATGGVVTVNVLEVLASAQPPVPVTVYVIVTVPAAIPVIKPVVLLMNAILLSELTQVPPVVEELNELVPPIQIACTPLNVPALGGAVTFINRTAVAFAQPPVPATEYVIVAVPAATPVTNPVEEFIVAIEPLELVQLPPEIEEESVLVPAIQIACVPDNVPATGAAVTVTTRVAVAFVQPPVPRTVYVMVALPAVSPATKPEVELMVAIALEEVLHVPPEPEELSEVLPPIQID